MDSDQITYRDCYRAVAPVYANLTHLTSQNAWLLMQVCAGMKQLEDDSATADMYSSPMVLIGIYISIASLFCILAMALDLLHGFRNRKFWFPTKYFSLNAASITVITVAMKLPVDLTSPMPGRVDQAAKVGSLAFMCTMMSNFMPSLGSMDNKSLVANITGLTILVVTVVVDAGIQVRTHVIDDAYTLISLWILPPYTLITDIFMCMLLFLLLILISSAIKIPTSKKILESKYLANSKTTLIDQHPQENRISTVEKLKQIVKKYWIMAETGSPQFVMASNPLSSASGIMCALSMALHIFVMWELVVWRKANSRPYAIDDEAQISFGSVYKGSMIGIAITQSIGTVVGSIAPIFRCFTVLNFKAFANENRKHFRVFKVEKYWTQKLYEWKESRISFMSSRRSSRVLLHNLKNNILSFCIGFQKVVVVSCKILGLIPIVVIIFVVHCSRCFKSVKAKIFNPPMASSSDNRNQNHNDVLLLDDNVRLAEKTMKGISDSMNRLLKKAEKKQHKNLLKLLEKSISFDGVDTFDTLPSVEHVNSWSLPIISLTCIAIALQNNHKDIVDDLLKSVCEGLMYIHIVEESLNKASKYVNIRRATLALWHEVEDKRKWLDNSLESSYYQGKTIELIKWFAHKAEENVNEFNTSTGGRVAEENLPPKVVAAKSMYRIAQTIIHMYGSNEAVTEDELFTRLSRMIADILAACLTNIPRVITTKCHEKTIEKREASVMAAIDLLGRTTEIIKRVETRELPNMDPVKMGFIDEWRLYLKQP